MTFWSRAGRRADTPVDQAPLGTERYFLHHPAGSVLEVRAGTTVDGMSVYATTDEPRRWFAVFSGADAPEGVWALILWEVHGDTGQHALARRASGHADAATLVGVVTDVAITRTPAPWGAS